MFAVSFDLVISDLKTHYGNPYNRAYFEIKVLQKAIVSLSKIDWFKKSVRDIRGFKVENWSDFTEIVRNS